ncbi:MAG: alpha/beta hydrolase [Lachnospiraceae bacterium]|nr:alpha/beta hydrolase [Lachnospiraceae bacterium]
MKNYAGYVKVLLLSLVLLLETGCTVNTDINGVKNRIVIDTSKTDPLTTVSGNDADAEYICQEHPLERNGISLYLDCMVKDGEETDNNILLIHGLTYSSHIFDIDYKDYSLVRRLAREGYAVWRLDISGYGRSGEVEDGFMPDNDYAAEDIALALEYISHYTGQDRIDLFGWSWGTVTTGRCAAKHPEHINKLVLYAPILSGIGAHEISDEFCGNEWIKAVEDFQTDESGNFDLSITDPVLIEMYASSCWHYDGASSPNGGRRDLCVDNSEIMIDLKKIDAPTLVICGSKDPYLDYELIDGAIELLPEGSRLEMIDGGSHVVFYEEPYYHDFQDRLLKFLRS